MHRSIVLLLVLLLVSCQHGETRSEGQLADGQLDRTRSLLSSYEVNHWLFFAVIEGLYRDGVSTEVARSIATIDEESGFPVNFVYGCPICIPVLDAVRVYLHRPGFYRDKRDRDTFGPGLDAAARESLLSIDAVERRRVLQQLIDRWVAEHLTRSSFDEADLSALQQLLREMRKKGMAMLTQFQSEEETGIDLDFYKGWQSCPSCEGANGGQ